MSCEKENCGGCAEDEKELKQCLGKIRHKILVMSGKGGVGKSTVAVNLAAALAMEGKRVGLLDVDIHGPSIPTMLHLAEKRLTATHGKLTPVRAGGLIEVMSIGFLLRECDDSVIWRGPVKMGVIKQFLTEVDWGELDYLIIDSPPGTGDEPLSICQLIGDADGAVVVTTPQEVSAADVRKSIDFCVKLNLPVLGIVENMSGFVCPNCGAVHDILGSGGGERLSEQTGVPFLGRIPIDPEVARSGDDGDVYLAVAGKSPASVAFKSVIAAVGGALGAKAAPAKE